MIVKHCFSYKPVEVTNTFYREMVSPRLPDPLHSNKCLYRAKPVGLGPLELRSCSNLSLTRNTQKSSVVQLSIGEGLRALMIGIREHDVGIDEPPSALL